MESRADLAEYVARRARLAGKGLLTGQSPYNLEVDLLESQSTAAGHDFVNLANYDYLGLDHDPRVREAAKLAIDSFGTGAGASRLVGGERSVHRKLERSIADFVGLEDCISTVSGYGLNMSFIGHLLSSSDLVLVDELSHNSIFAGLKLSRATTISFKHNDINHLEYLLTRFRNAHKNVLIIAEGLYSMDGDMPDLAQLVEVKNRWNAWLMLDEAHSIGCLGATGRGLSEHFGLPPQEIDFMIGTLSKALVGSGGFICASADVIFWLRHTLPSYVYSVGLSPSVAGGAIAALEIIQAEPQRVAKLQRNSKRFLEGAISRGLSVGTSSGHSIVPIIVSTKDIAMRASAALMEKGIYLPPIIQQATSGSSPRLRVFLSAAYSTETIDNALDTIRNVLTDLGEIQHSYDNVVAISQ